MSAIQSADISVEIETKFTEGYRAGVDAAISQPVFSTVTNPDNSQDILFADSGGNIGWIHADSSSETGYTQTIFPPFEPDIIAIQAFYDDAGRLTVAIASTRIFFILYPDTGEFQYIAFQPGNVDPAQNTIDKAQNIYVSTINGNIYVGLLYYTDAGFFNLYYTCWTLFPNKFSAAIGVNFPSAFCAWLANSDGTASFICLDSSAVIFTIDNTSFNTDNPSLVADGNSSKVLPISINPTNWVDVSVATTPSGSNHLFAIDAYRNSNDNQMYADIVYMGTINRTTTALNYYYQVTSGMHFHQLFARWDEQNKLHLFGVSEDERLYHLTFDPSASSHARLPIPILSDVSFADIPITGNEVDVFTLSHLQNNIPSTLTHVYLEDLSDNWGLEAVNLPGVNKMEPFITYSSDIIVYDNNGAVVPNTPVSINATEETIITVNGKTWFTDATHAVSMNTNSVGMLSIYQETGSLAVPTLKLSFPNLSSQGFVLIDQSAVVQQQLSTVQGNDLLQAKDAAGNYLLTGQYYNPDTAKALAQSLNQCMTLNLDPPHGGQSLLLKSGRTAPGVWWYQGDDLAAVRRLRAKGDYGFHLFVDKNGILQFEMLSAKDAAELRRKTNTTIRSTDFEWPDSIGDIVKSVADGIASVANTLVEVVGNAVEVTIGFVVDGVTYVFNQVIQYMEDAYDLVEAILSIVLVGFEKIWEWLGYLFDWDDIVRTHEVIAASITQCVGFLGGSMARIQYLVDTGFSNLQANLNAVFTNGNSIVGNQTIGNYCNSYNKPSDSFYSATANNVVYNGFMNNLSAITFSMKDVANSDTGPFDPLTQALQNLLTTAQNTPAYVQLSSYFINLGKNADQVFSQLLNQLLSLIQTFANAVLSGVQAITDQLLQLGQVLIDAINAFLTTPLEIPFVTSFYSWVTDGSTLTVADLVALIVAIPTTVAYKIKYDKAPFPDDLSVTAFTNTYTSQYMLQRAGFAKAGNITENHLGDAQETARIFSLITTFGTFIFGCVTAANDGYPELPPPGLSKVDFCLELIMQFFSFPWVTTTGGPSCDPENGDGMAKTLWLIQFVGIALDAFSLACESRLPENSDDASVIAEFVYGLLHLDIAIMASKHTSPAVTAVNIVPVIPELCKLLRLTAVQAATEGAAPVVLAVLDVASYIATAVLVEELGQSGE